MVAKPFQEVLDALPQQLAILDEAGTIVFVNAAWRHFALDNGASLGDSALGQSYFCELDDASDDEDVRTAHIAYRGIREVLSGQKGHYRLEYPCHSPTQKRWFLLEVSPREEGGAIVTHSDISAQVKQRLLLQQHAYYDQLTGLANRLHFYTQARHLLKAAKRYTRRFAVLFIDLDGFKAVNDTLGHDAGDYLLIKLAKRLEHQARESDLVARWGGDEFVMLLELKGETELEHIIERLLKSIETPVVINQQEVRVSASIGYVFYPDDEKNIRDLVRKADKRMYKTKTRRKASKRAPPPSSAGTSQSVSGTNGD